MDEKDDETGANLLQEQHSDECIGQLPGSWGTNG